MWVSGQQYGGCGLTQSRGGGSLQSSHILSLTRLSLTSSHLSLTSSHSLNTLSHPHTDSLTHCTLKWTNLYPDLNTGSIYIWQGSNVSYLFWQNLIRIKSYLLCLESIGQAGSSGGFEFLCSVSSPLASRQEASAPPPPSLPLSLHQNRLLLCFLPQLKLWAGALQWVTRWMEKWWDHWDSTPTPE